MNLTTQETRETSYLKTVADYLALRRDLSVLLGVILLIGVGEEIWGRFVPKYLEVLGAGALVIGLFGTLKDLLDALYQYPGGIISDRLGCRRALIVFNLLAVLGYVIYLFAPGWEAIFIGTLFVTAWSSLSLPATFSIIGDSLPRNKRAMGFAVQSIIRRIPMIAGPPLGGVMIVAAGVRGGVRAGIAVSIIMALASIALQRKCYAKDCKVEPKPPSERQSVLFLVRSLHPGLRRLLWADILARTAEGIPKPFIVLYALNVVGATPAQFGLLTALSMAISIAVYVPVARLADRSADRSQYIALTFLFFALTPLCIVLSKSVLALVAAFVVVGLREIAEPTRKATIVDLASTERTGTDVGVYYMLRQLAVVPCGFIGGLLWSVSPQAPFWVAFCFGIVGAAAFWAASRSRSC